MLMQPTKYLKNKLLQKMKKANVAGRSFICLPECYKYLCILFQLPFLHIPAYSLVMFTAYLFQGYDVKLLILKVLGIIVSSYGSYHLIIS